MLIDPLGGYPAYEIVKNEIAGMIGTITAEQREDQVKNAVRLHYAAKGKPKPQINFVLFVAKDQNEKTVPMLAYFENIAQRARGGKVRVLQGLAALKNVTSR